MNFKDAVKSCFSKYATFKGRAIRSEYWYWQLFSISISILTNVIDAYVFNSGNFGDSGNIDSINVTNAIFNLVVFLPTLAVSIRRLHDVGRRGWWILIFFTVIGILVLLYWAIKEGDKEENAFGAPHQLATDTV